MNNRILNEMITNIQYYYNPLVMISLRFLPKHNTIYIDERDSL